MNWALVGWGFAMAVLMGAGLASLLPTIRPHWSPRRRQLIAASVLPAITAVATLLAILFISTAEHGVSENMEDLAIAAVATVGGGFVFIALAGGVIGAMLAGRRRGP